MLKDLDGLGKGLIYSMGDITPFLKCAVFKWVMDEKNHFG